jgi:acyl-homoserine lactone acylase PvdQ
MKIETIEEKIKAKANANVQAKIAKFKAAIDGAMTELLGNGDNASFTFGDYIHAERNSHILGAVRRLAVLRLAIQSYDQDPKDCNRKVQRPWPASLWDVEAQTIRDDLMAKMDTMQQLLMANSKKSDDDAVPDTVASNE